MKAGWKLVTLAEVSQLRPNKKEVKQVLNDDDEVSFVPMDCLQVENINLGEHKARTLGSVYSGYTYFSDGDVLMAKITPCFENGKLGVADSLTNGIGFGSSEFFVIRPSNQLDRKYLYHFLNQRRFRTWAKDRMTGAVGHKRVPKELIEALEIPLPPLEEQQRIVAVLDEAFEGLTRAREHAEANLLNLNHLRQSLLQRAFAGELTHVKADWAQRPLGTVCELRGGGTPSKQNSAFWSGDVPWVSPKDMKSEVIDGSIDYVTDLAVQNSAVKWIPEGAILIVVRSGILARKIPIAVAGRNLTVNQDLKALVTSKGLDTRFLAYFLQSAEQKLLSRVTRGATVHKLDTAVIKSLEIPLPPLEEQQRLVAVLDEAFEGLTRAREHAEANLLNLNHLRQSLLQRAFAGELT